MNYSDIHILDIIPSFYVAITISIKGIRMVIKVTITVIIIIIITTTIALNDVMIINSITTTMIAIVKNMHNCI